MWYNLWSNLSKKKLKLPPSSLIVEKQDERDAQFEEIFGAADFGDRPSRNWKKWLPKHEIQSYGDCVNFSLLNCVETKAKEGNIKDNDGNELNLSDLYLAVGSGTTKTGNSMNRVAQWFKNNGSVLEKECPYTRNWNSRETAFNNVSKDTVRYGKSTGHVWVKNNRNSMKSALEQAPLQIGVGLGNTYQNGGVIKPPSSIQVWHAIMAYYVDEKDQVHCYDHYNRQNVILSADYDIPYIKQYVPDGLPDGWQTLNAEALKMWKRLWGKLIIRPEAHGEVYRVWSHTLQKVTFDISDEKLFNEIHEALREKKLFIGVSEEDFERIKLIMQDYKGRLINQPEEIIDVSKILE